MPDRIGLVTDFGSKAGYVASMKGVILSICEDCSIIDLSHDISPQNVVEAAFFLDNCCLYFPEGFIFLIVVDPGVGTDRKTICIKTKMKNQYFVAPDNGVLDLVIQEQGISEAISLDKKDFWRDTISHTFHGRDIMAPIAAHVAKDIDLTNLGSRIQPDDIASLVLPPECKSIGNKLEGHVLYVDIFGNVITNIKEEDFMGFELNIGNPFLFQIHDEDKLIKTVTAPFQQFYSEVDINEYLCLFNSENRFELAINQGNAAKSLNIIDGFPKITIKPIE